MGTPKRFAVVVSCLCAAMIASAPAIGASPASSALFAGEMVPQDVLEGLGFSPTSGTIGNDGYVQLVVALYIADGNMDFNYCPKGSIWGVDLKNVTKGDTKTTFGVKVEAPIIPAVTLNPIIFSQKSAGIFGMARDCNLTVDAIKYRSPMYYVRKNKNRQFIVSPNYANASALGPQTRENLNAIVSALSLMSGVPAATAAPYLGVIERGLEGASIENQQQLIGRFEIEPGPVRAPYIWRVGEVVPKTQNKPSLDIVLIAQVVPVPTIISAPDYPQEWQPSTVLNTAFNIGAGGASMGDGTLGSYVGLVATKEQLSYSEANSHEAANTACSLLSTKIDSMGLSDRDAALTLWALVKRRVTLGKATTEEIDNLPCLTSNWPTLAAARVIRGEVPSPPVAPTVRQMKATIEIDDALAMFFRSSTWTEQSRHAGNLFSYPVVYSDPASMIMRGTTSVDNTNGWLVNAFERDRPLLTKIGCFAYFDVNDVNGFAKARGSKSMMTAIGEVAELGDTTATRELALQISFSPTADGSDPKIDRIDVQTQLAADAKAAMIEAIGSASTCRSKYDPKILFGN